MTEFGAFIEIEEGIDGLVHISDLSWTKRVKHPSEILRKGSIVQAVILAIDADHKRLSLGIKQLQPDAWETWFQQHNVNDTVHGKVLRLAGFGAFVELAEGVEGLCHFSEVPGWSGRKSDPPPLTPGEEMDFKIIRMNEAERKIGLSLKAHGRGARSATGWTSIRSGPQRPVPASKISCRDGTRLSRSPQTDCKMPPFGDTHNFP